MFVFCRPQASDSTQFQVASTSPRPLGLLELSSGLDLDRGPAFSPAQFSLGRSLIDQDNVKTSLSQDSLPFAEEDASLVESLQWDQSGIVQVVKQDSPR